jgi:hypothetical protein
MPMAGRIPDELRQARATLAAAKAVLRQTLESRPQAAVRVGRVRRACRLLIFRLRARRAERTLGDPYLAVGRVFYVPVAALRRRTALPFGYNPTRRPAAVVPGDWDQRPETIADKPDSIEFREALQGKRPWTETAAFRRKMQPAESETRPWRRRALTAEAHRAISGWEALYESMRAVGALPQGELARRGGPAYQPTNTDDISIAIGRTGELQLCQGNHRVEAALALGIEAVPVWVGVRHAEWWALRRRIVAYAAAHGGVVPEPLLHPDLDNIPFACDCDTRFDLVAAALPASAGSVVDAVPGWGYFLHRFEERGFDCTGIARIAEDRYFLERLRIAGERHFAIADAVESDAVPAEEPAAALLLLRDTTSWLVGEAAHASLAALLARTRPRHVFVEVGAGEGTTPVGTELLSSGSDMVRVCAAGMARPHVRLLGRVGTRCIYHVFDADEATVDTDEATEAELAPQEAHGSAGGGVTKGPRSARRVPRTQARVAAS